MGFIENSFGFDVQLGADHLPLSMKKLFEV